MAIVDVWSFTIRAGKRADVMAWFKKSLDHHVSHGLKCRLLNPINGLTARVYWESEYESLDAMAAYLKAFWVSDAWTKDLSKEPFADWFDDASATRHQYSIVE